LPFTTLPSPAVRVARCGAPQRISTSYWNEASRTETRASGLEERAHAHAVKAAADLAVAREARLDARPRAERLADAREDGAGVRLLADVARRARAELAHALEQVLLPREEDDRHVAERDVAPERAAQREAVHLRHQDVADDEVGARPVRGLERLRAVEGLVHDAAGRAEQVRHEPDHRGVVVRDHHAATGEPDVGGAAAQLLHAIAAGDVVGRERRHRQRALRAGPEEAHVALGPGRHDLADLRDRPPHGGQHLAALAERDLRVAHRRIDARDDRLAELGREPLAELRERRVAELDTHRRGAAAGLERLLARAAQRVALRRLGERLGDAHRDVARRLALLLEAADDDDRGRLRERVVHQRLDELEGVGQVGVEHDEVGLGRLREVERGLRVGRALAGERRPRRQRGLEERLGHHGVADDQRAVARRAHARRLLARHGASGVAPRQRRQLAEQGLDRLEIEILDRSVDGRPVDDAERLEDAAVHHVELHQLRAGRERLELLPELLAPPEVRGLLADASERGAQITHLAAEAGHEVGARSTQPRAPLTVRLFRLLHI
jgi:hypothetical protein